MSKWERVNLTVLRSCCITVIHSYPANPADGATLPCSGCGLPIVFTSGIWTRG